MRRKKRKSRRKKSAQSETQARVEKPRAAPRPLGRRKRAIFAALALACGLVAAVAIAEVVMRVSDLEPPRHEKPRWQVRHQGKFHDCNMVGQEVVPGKSLIKIPGPFASQGFRMGEYIPGAEFRVVYDSNPRGYFDEEGGVTMRINSLGMRGPEVAVQKPPHTFRILGLGDSFTFGVGVRDEHTFLRRLEVELNEFAAPPRRYEVLNAGVQGYNTRDEILYLEHRWLQLDPDLILITFYLNDAYSDSAFRNMGQGLGIYLDQPGGLASYSYLADYVQHAWRARKVRQELNEYYAKSYFQQPDDHLEGSDQAEFDWNASRQALSYAARLAKERDIKIALVIFPEFESLDGEYPFREIHRLVRKTCEQHSIRVLDLLDTFHGRDPRDLWVHASDHHPNEFAHELAARAIQEFVVMNDLVTDKGGGTQ